MLHIRNQFKVRGISSDYWFIKIERDAPLPRGPGIAVFVGEPAVPMGDGFHLTFAVTTGHLERAWDLFPPALLHAGLTWSIGVMSVTADKEQLEIWAADLQAGLSIHLPAA